MITIHTLLVPIAAFALAAFLFFSTATAFTSRSRARAMQPGLTHLWRTAIALLLAAIYVEIKQ